MVSPAGKRRSPPKPINQIGQPKTLPFHNHPISPIPWGRQLAGVVPFGEIGIEATGVRGRQGASDCRTHVKGQRGERFGDGGHGISGLFELKGRQVAFSDVKFPICSSCRSMIGGGNEQDRMDRCYLESRRWLHRCDGGLHKLLCHANGCAIERDGR